MPSRARRVTVCTSAIGGFCVRIDQKRKNGYVTATAHRHEPCVFVPLAVWPVAWCAGHSRCVHIQICISLAPSAADVTDSRRVWCCRCRRRRNTPAFDGLFRFAPFDAVSFIFWSDSKGIFSIQAVGTQDGDTNRTFSSTTIALNIECFFTSLFSGLRSSQFVI